MKRFAVLAFVFVIVVSIYACGGTFKANTMQSSSAQSSEDNPSPSAGPATGSHPSPSATSFHDEEAIETVTQFKGGTMTLINKVIAEASVHDCFVRPEIVLYGYSFNEETEELYVYFKYINPYDKFMLAGLESLDFTVITNEGQKVDGSLNKGQEMFLAKGNLLRYFFTSGVAAKPAQIIIGDTEINLSSTQTLQLESVELPSDPIHPDYDVSAVFRALSEKSEHLKDLAWIETAVIDEVSYSEDGIKMTMTITPSRYISGSFFRGDIWQLRFALVNDNNEAISAWLVDGVESDEQLPANIPFTYYLFFDPMTNHSETFRFCVANLYTIYPEVGPSTDLSYDAISTGGFNTIDGSIIELISHTSDNSESMTSDDTTETESAGEPTFTYASASSTLPAEGIYSYDAGNVLDGDLSTCWCEHNSGLGIGEWIEISSDDLQNVSGVILYNGYQKNQDILDKNGYVTSLRLEFSDGSYEVFEDIDSILQYLDFEPRKTTYIKIIILEAKEGSIYSDVCISEVMVY